MIATSGDKQLLWLLPGVQTAEAKLRGFAESRGITYHIADYGGARTQSIVTQLLKWRDEAVAQGEPFYRVSPWGHTKHAYGGAFDIRIDSYPDSMSEEDAYSMLGAQAPQYGLIWGGTFSAPADIYHFESQQPLSALQARWNDWVNDPSYPKGFIDPVVMIAVALIGLLVWFLFLR